MRFILKKVPYYTDYATTKRAYSTLTNMPVSKSLPLTLSSEKFRISFYKLADALLRYQALAYRYLEIPSVKRLEHFFGHGVRLAKFFVSKQSVRIDIRRHGVRVVPRQIAARFKDI